MILERKGVRGGDHDLNSCGRGQSILCFLPGVVGFVPGVFGFGSVLFLIFNSNQG